MIQTVNYNGKDYPSFQTNGNAARFCMPFALEVCKGFGVDVGCNRAEWSLPGSVLIDPAIDPELDAYDLPDLNLDYVFSSHCLEHLRNWVEAIEHWHSKLRRGGNLFLYLPDMDSQHYWRPWCNRKHVHYLTPAILRAYFEDTQAMWGKVFVSNVDMYNSFTVIAEKI